MSAFLCTSAHIDALVQSLIHHQLVPMEKATETGRMFVRENLISLQYRYNDDIDESTVEAYSFRGVEAELEPLAISLAIHCFEYQACESGSNYYNGENTASHALLQSLADALGVDCYETTHLTAEEIGIIHDAPWGIDDIGDVVKGEVRNAASAREHRRQLRIAANPLHQNVSGPRT